MNLRNVGVPAVALLCGLAFIAVGCGTGEIPGATSSDATSTGNSETADTSRLYPVLQDGQWGYIDRTGTVVVEPQFDHALDFAGGLAPVRVGDAWGYLDTSGTMVIQPQFDAAGPFSEGLAPVGRFLSDHQLWGFIDETGTVVIPMQYWLFDNSFSEGLCVVSVEESGPGPWGYIDAAGTMVIEPQFLTAEDFSEGLAAVSGADDTTPHGFIDKTGGWVIELPPDLTLGKISSGFSEGLAVVRELPSGEIGSGPVMPEGYIDKNGAVVIQPQFEVAADFSEGLAAVGVRENDVVTWGYIDASGTMVIQPQFDTVLPFSEGLAAVAIPPADRHDAEVFIGDCRWCYIDEAGAVVITLQEKQVGRSFYGGVARVDTITSVTSGLDSMAYIDTTGRVIWQEQ